MDRRGTIWQRVDPSVLTQSPSPASPPLTDQEKRRKARRTRRTVLILDLIGSLAWLYVILKVFVFDVDRAILIRVAPDALELLDYRFFFFLGVVALVVVLFKKYWLGILYVVLYPLVVLLWKIPRLIYRTRSWLVLFAVINVVSSFLKDFKFNFLTKALAVFCAFAILVFRQPVLMTLASLTLVGLLLVSYYRNVGASFAPSRFIDLQVGAIERFIEFEPVVSNIYIAEDLKAPSIERFDEPQLRRFASNLGTGMLTVRGIYFWAYQLERYRQSPAVSFFSLLSYTWLFVITLLTVWFVNLSLLKLDPSLFEFTDYPSNITVLYYSLTSLVLNSIPALEPVGDLAILVKISAGIIGVLLLITFLANVFFSSRRQRQEEALEDAVREVKQRAQTLEERLGEEYEVTPEEATEWLEKIGFGFIKMMTFLSSRIPDDFLKPPRTP